MTKNNYVIINQEDLPEVFDRVIEVKLLLNKNPSLSITNAVKKVGISRSAYYKYHDKITLAESRHLNNLNSIIIVFDRLSEVLKRILKVLAGASLDLIAVNQAELSHDRQVLTVTVAKSKQEQMRKLISSLKRLYGVRKVQKINYSES